jgi:asparagine synthase (glutamine-hydrolysing)
MCGISAIFSYRGGQADHAELEAITAKMIPRGPDAGATWVSPEGHVGLGSRRLAILDPTPAGIQPMHDMAGELTIVFNGEIYNHAELRASLERGGARFRTATDTEVLLELYRRDGVRMLGLLRGMFAFVLWDARDGRMLVARDGYGIKPLYMADDGSTVRFASEVKALVAGGRVSTALDPAGAAGFLLTGSIPEPFTIRRDIKVVEAGTWFWVTEHGSQPAQRHFSIPDTYRAAAYFANPELVHAPTQLRERVAESVAAHLVSDVPVGLFLSAGIDSSALLATASRIRPIQTFTLAFDEFGGMPDDESPLAERFAAACGVPHVTRRVSREEFLADLPAFLRRMDQPTIDGVNTWFVSKAAHESGVKTVLSGLGGDELLGSYPSFANVPRFMALARRPLLAKTLSRFSSHPKARRVASMGSSWGSSWLLQRGLFFPEDLPSILGAGVAAEGLARLGLAAHVESQLSPDPETAFGRIATLESSLYMRNQLLRDADWASMSHSVEVRTPLVDVSLLRQLAPTLLKCRETCKSALAEMLPPWLRERKKTGFFVPMREWLDLPDDGTSTRMRSWARRVLTEYTGGEIEADARGSR